MELAAAPSPPPPPTGRHLTQHRLQEVLTHIKAYDCLLELWERLRLAFEFKYVFVNSYLPV